MKSLQWLPDDTKLVSAGVDGAVYEWRLKDFKRSKENVLKASSLRMHVFLVLDTIKLAASGLAFVFVASADKVTQASKS